MEPFPKRTAGPLFATWLSLAFVRSCVRACLLLQRNYLRDHSTPGAFNIRFGSQPCHELQLRTAANAI